MFNKKDKIKLKGMGTQKGEITTIRRLGVENGFIVTWDAGPMYPAGKKMAFFGMKGSNKLEMDV